MSFSKTLPLRHFVSKNHSSWIPITATLCSKLDHMSTSIMRAVKGLYCTLGLLLTASNEFSDVKCSNLACINFSEFLSLIKKYILVCANLSDYYVSH